MAFVNKYNYLQSKRVCNVSKDWWTVKHRQQGYTSGIVFINSIVFPKELIGKKVRFKVEFIDDEDHFKRIRM